MAKARTGNHHPAEERSKGDFACSAENRMLLKHFVARSKDATDTTVHIAPEGAGIAGCNHNLQFEFSHQGSVLLPDAVLGDGTDVSFAQHGGDESYCTDENYI